MCFIFIYIRLHTSTKIIPPSWIPEQMENIFSGDLSTNNFISRETVTWDNKTQLNMDMLILFYIPF